MAASTPLRHEPLVAAPPRPRIGAWRLFRPLLHPLACRLRSFLLGPMQAEIAALRLEIATLREELPAPRPIEPEIDAALERALLTLALDREIRRP